MEGSKMTSVDCNKNEDEKKDEDFRPREYQVEIVERAKKENVIVFLPTGSGKTFIAMMLIKEYLSELKARKFSEGGKRTFFLVNTTPLVKQQADAVRSMIFVSDDDVGEYTGDIGVDYFNKDRWIREQDNHLVLVMTSQIYLNMILGSYTSFKQASILIFDECHHAVKNHAMRQIMLEMDKVTSGPKPKILGLTATLLNADVKSSQVKNEVVKLETTFHARVVRAINDEMVMQFAANPKEMVILYKKDEEHTTWVSDIIKEYTVKVKTYLKVLELPELKREADSAVPIGAVPLKSVDSKPLRETKLMLTDLEKTAEELGLFGADIGLLTLIVFIERLKMATHDSIYRVLCSVETGLHLIRKKLSKYIAQADAATQSLYLASDKVVRLAELLKEYPINRRSIIFVDRRSTAHVLHHIIKNLSRNNQAYRNIKSDYIVGVNRADLPINRENILTRKKNKAIMQQFNAGELNVLFASNVIEEGVDIRACNLVIKFDMPITFRSYTQSKGRARNKASQYIIIAAEGESGKSDIQMKYHNFRAIEHHLKDVLCNENFRAEVSAKDDDADSFQEYVNKFGSKVTGLEAISCINSYCSLLPQDKFCKLTAVWWIKENMNQGEKVYVAYLRLPVNSDIKTVIEGPPRKSKMSAKRMVALKACEMLDQHGAFDSHFRPLGQKTNLLNDINIFPKWREDYFKQNLSEKGKKERQFFNKHYSYWECNSRPLKGKDVYMHIIEIQTNYDFPDTSRLQAFYLLLRCKNTFCVLTTCPWPELPQFPLFMNVGEMKVKLLNNYTFIQLTNQEIKELDDFQKILFTDALQQLKNYSAPNSPDFHTDDYIIAPVSFENDSYILDWNTIRNEKEFPEIKPKPFQQRLLKPVKEDDYYMKIVIPWYRLEDYNLKYVVTKVRTDLNPQSEFPSDNSKTYSDYFLQKYNQKIYDNEQPLLEVRAISSKINCILPRGQYNSSRRQKKEQGFEETLVPELCYLITFPAWCLVKVTLLPSALHRIHHLLVAEELRQQIVCETGLGTFQYLNGLEWKELTVDNQCQWSEDEQNGGVIGQLAIAVDVDVPTPTGIEEDEPPDLDRDLIDVDLTAIIHYSEFVNEPMDTSFNLSTNEVKNLRTINHKEVTPITIINGIYPDYGPEPVDILQALTAASSNDIMNYERIELLGDSFLKFATSMALFTFYPDLNEGQLTQVKGKIVGNMNLFFCGLNMNLASKLKVNAFDYNDWKVPGYSLLPEIMPFLKDPISCAEFLGKLSLLEMDDVEEEIASFVRSNGASCPNRPTLAIEYIDSTNNKQLDEDSFDDSSDEELSYSHKTRAPLNKDEYLMRHLVPNKVISDSVEALISVYVQNFGITGGFKILAWLGVLPEFMCDTDAIFYSELKSPLLNSNCDMASLLPNGQELEATIGYSFKDKAHLLQALSHPSYTHNMTDCYQKYEFLGDAVLDFLLTAYIFQECKDMNPGDMTDLRSALVNNVTFACLAVRYKFHTHLLSKACELNDIIFKFVEYQKSRDHQIGYEVFYLIEESEVNVAECIDVPKVLGDIFESIIGAVYLDSGRDLNRVWRVIYNIMENEIVTFTKEIPKNLIRVMYEKFPKPPPKFGKTEVHNNCVIIPVEVCHNNTQKIFHGIGENKYFAKIAAAKMALHHFKMC